MFMEFGHVMAGVSDRSFKERMVERFRWRFYSRAFKWAIRGVCGGGETDDASREWSFLH